MAATTTGSPENRHTTLSAGVSPSQTTLTSGNRPATPTHTPSEPRSTARHGPQRARLPANQAKAPGKRTRAGKPHHHAGTAPRGSHREQEDALKRIANRRGLATDGDVHTIDTSETKRKAEGHRDVLHDGSYMYHWLQGGAGHVVPIFKTFLSRGHDGVKTRSQAARDNLRGPRNTQGTQANRPHRPQRNAPSQPTTTPTSTTAHCNSTHTQRSNHHCQTTLHCNWRNQDTTDQRQHEQTGYRNHIRQQSDGTHAGQANHRAAKTTAHQPHRSCSRNLTIHRPHASLSTLNQPGVHGSKREQHQTGGQHHGAPQPPTTMPTDTTEHCNSTSTQPADQHKHTTLRCNRTTQDATNWRRRERTGYTNTIRLCKHRQQHDGTSANQTHHEAAKTTAQRPQHSCSRDLTINTPHASRPTPNQPGLQGSKRERHQTGRPHCDAPHSPTTIPTDTTEHRNTYHHATDKITLTNSTKPPAPRDSASSIESGGVSKRHGMRVP